jgi:hypothetical protein
MHLKQFWQDRDIFAHEEIRIITNSVLWRSGYESDVHEEDVATAWDSSRNTYDSTGKSVPRGSDAKQQALPLQMRNLPDWNSEHGWFLIYFMSARMQMDLHGEDWKMEKKKKKKN